MRESKQGYRIIGRVQGVFFRAWTQELAESLGLRGTVENLDDGSVEAHAVGAPEAMKTFEERLAQGPPAAQVEEVKKIEPREDLPGEGFRILRGWK